MTAGGQRPVIRLQREESGNGGSAQAADTQPEPPAIEPTPEPVAGAGNDTTTVDSPSPHSPSDREEEDSLFAELAETGASALAERYTQEIDKVLGEFGDVADRYCVLGLYTRDDTISAFEMDQIYEAITRANGEKQKDVLLVMVGPGGRVEPAYHIARLGKAFARDRFVVAVPREAKSAATLIALGADTIHMGLLGELGPIDPQLGGLPALAVEQALRTVAELTAEFPASGTMFATYLKDAISIEQIGYSQRIGQSAVQYAEMLLRPKQARLNDTPENIANHLVYGLKDHSFVIDRDEAARWLGDVVVNQGREVDFAERVYRKISFFDLACWRTKQRLEIVGELRDGAKFWKRK
jgi:hypothetical protein